MMAECFISTADFPKKGPCAVLGVDCGAAEPARTEATGNSITNTLLPASLLTEANIKQFSVLKRSHFSIDPCVSTPYHCFLRLQLPAALVFDRKCLCLLLRKVMICSASLWNVWYPLLTCECAVSPEGPWGLCLIPMTYIYMEAYGLSFCHSFLPNWCQPLLGLKVTMLLISTLIFEDWHAQLCQN